MFSTDIGTSFFTFVFAVKNREKASRAWNKCAVTSWVIWITASKTVGIFLNFEMFKANKNFVCKSACSCLFFTYFAHLETTRINWISPSRRKNANIFSWHFEQNLKWQVAWNKPLLGQKKTALGWLLNWREMWTRVAFSRHFAIWVLCEAIQGKQQDGSVKM